MTFLLQQIKLQVILIFFLVETQLRVGYMFTCNVANKVNENINININKK